MGTFICVTLIVLAFIPFTVMMSHSNDLYCDELYTWKIAQAPSVSQVITMSHQLDLHPPVHYLFERAALALPLPRWLGARLPSLIAGQITLLAIFWMFKKWKGNLAGLLAAVSLWFTPIVDYSWSNRPYAIWYMFLMLTVLFWSESIQTERRWWHLVALTLSGACMALTHMFGLACLGAVYVAEAARIYRRRAIDWPVAIALLLPSLSLLSYFAQIKSMGVNTYSPRYLPSLSVAYDMYLDILMVALPSLAACILVAHLIDPEAKTFVSSKDIPLEYWVMGGVLALMPLFLMVATTIHPMMFFSRYGVFSAIGFALLMALFSMSMLSKFRVVAVLMAVGLLIGVAVRIHRETGAPNIYARYDLRGLHPVSLTDLNPNIPIVVGAGTEFTELNDREPYSVAKNLYYLTDYENAQKYSGQTVWDSGEEKAVKLLNLPGKAVPLDEFLAKYHTFYLIGNYLSTEEWITRYLLDRGDHVEICGKVFSLIRNDDLFKVTTVDHPAFNRVTNESGLNIYSPATSSFTTPQ